jgi:hypothetical protein
MKILTKQRYVYTQGIDWRKGEILHHWYIEHGIRYVLFGFIKWKHITVRTSKKRPLIPKKKKS